MRIFRLHRGQRLASDYDGSLRYAGRWNPPGIPMLYASTALSLACLEQLVHMSAEQIPVDYVYSTAELPVSPEMADFRGDLQDQAATRRFGHRWVTQGNALAIYVPSVIIPIEFNVLLNPLHDGFKAIAWHDPQPFKFDERLLRAAGRTDSTA